MGRIRCKAAVVIRFIDTVTQAPVSGSSLYIQVVPKSPLIWKEDGYVVIMEQPGVDSLDISVSCSSFSPVRFHVALLREAPVPIRYVRLLPATGYPFTERMAVIRGTAAQGELYALRVADAGRYRIMENLTAGEAVVKLWGSERISPGQLLMLNEGERYEPVTLLEADDETEYGYRITEPLKESWRKGKTKLYSAVRISTDDEGRFCIAYDRIQKGGETIRFWGGQEINKADMELEIREGQELEIDVGR